MAFVASSIASSRSPFAKETPASVNNSSALFFSAALTRKVAKSMTAQRANNRLSEWKIDMGNGYRAPWGDASDLGGLMEVRRFPFRGRESTDPLASGENDFLVLQPFARALKQNRIANRHHRDLFVRRRMADELLALLNRVDGLVLVRVIEPQNHP